MNELELLLRWPGWEKKTPDALLASEAWAMRARWGDEDVFLQLSDNRPRDIIALKIAFDDEIHFLGIGEREAFPDLAALWERKGEIPSSLVLALVEKECGKLFQLLENSVRRQLRVIGLTGVEERAGSQGFNVVNKRGEIIASFALNVSAMVSEAFGEMSAINVQHPSIRSMVRCVTAEYATFALGSGVEDLASGDYILTPELDNLLAARWCIDAPQEDGKYHLRAPTSIEATFANFADATLPEIEKPSALELFYGSRCIATGHYAKLGDASAFAVEEVL